MHRILSGVGNFGLPMDAACMGSLSNLYGIDDEEELERQLYFGLSPDEADVLGGDNGAVSHVCNTIHLIIAWKNT